MKKFATLTLAALALVAFPLNAQSIFVGAGAAFPTGDDMDGINTGLQLVGGATFDVASQLSIYGEGSWGSHGTDVDGVDVKPYAFMAGLLVDLTSDEDAAVTPYVYGGAGMQWVKLTGDGESVSDSALGFQFGAGLGFALGGLDAWAEGRYARAAFDQESDLGEFTFANFGITAGLSFNLGGS